MFESELEQQKEQVKRKRKTLEQQLEEAKAKEAAELKRLEQAKEKRKQLEQRQKKQLSESERKNDTRRKIMLGAWVLNKLKNDSNFKHELSDFRQFLNTESKTEDNRLKDAELFKGILWDD